MGPNPRCSGAHRRTSAPAASPATLQQLNRLRQQKVAQGWTFDPVYPAAMDRDLRVLASLRPADLALHATPVVNLFERDCNTIEIDGRRTRQVVHADRTRPRDFEIQRITRVEDADAEGAEAVVPELFSLGQNRGSGWVYSVERRPRRPGEDERRQGQTRTSYAGDDLFLAGGSDIERRRHRLGRLLRPSGQSLRQTLRAAHQ